jgi:hypothetical protein
VANLDYRIKELRAKHGDALCRLSTQGSCVVQCSLEDNVSAFDAEMDAFANILIELFDKMKSRGGRARPTSGAEVISLRTNKRA